MVAPCSRAEAKCDNTFSYWGWLDTGPISVAGSFGSPSLMVAARATILSTSASATLCSTSRREPARHVWPVAANTPAITPLAAASRSASANTTCADLPPSSSENRVMFSIAALPTWIPVVVDPVNAILSTPGCEASAAPVSGPQPVTTLMTPGGKPASANSFANASVDVGVWSLGLTTNVQPAASPAANFQVNSSSGEFQGVIAPTTPTGSWRV